MRVRVRPLFCKKCGAEQIRYAKICCCGRGVHCAPAFTLCKRRLYNNEGDACVPFETPVLRFKFVSGGRAGLYVPPKFRKMILYRETGFLQGYIFYKTQFFCVHGRRQTPALRCEIGFSNYAENPYFALPVLVCFVRLTL